MNHHRRGFLRRPGKHTGPALAERVRCYICQGEGAVLIPSRRDDELGMRVPCATCAGRGYVVSERQR